MGDGGRGGERRGAARGPGRGAAAPLAERAAPRAPEGARAPGRPGRSRPPAASPRPLPSPPPPALASISRLPLSPALRAPRPGALLPFPRGAPPAPPWPRARRRGLPTRGRPRGPRLRLQEALGLRQLPAEAVVLPQREKLAPPYCGAGRAGWCQPGCVFTALRWPLRYTFESLTGRLSINTGCARSDYPGEGCEGVFLLFFFSLY